MRHPRSRMILALAIVALAPINTSLADESPAIVQSKSITPPSQTQAAGANSTDDVGPAIVTDLEAGRVFRGTVEFGGTATDSGGVASVRVAIRNRTTGKWLHRDGKFRSAFQRIDATVQSSVPDTVVWHVALELPPGKYSASVRAFDTSSNRRTIRPGGFKVRRLGALLAAAGDVAHCGQDGHRQTASLLDEAFADREGVVALLGDGAYGEGSTDQYSQCYDPSWGRHKNRTRPAVGNHDYLTPQAAGYYNYFGARAGAPDRGYYAYDLKSWRILVLNSECTAAGGCGVGSAQYVWLRDQLANSGDQCVLTYSHRPRYTSGPHPDESRLQPLWNLLYEAGADVALAGHSHNYQRFKKMDAAGKIDSAGIRSFVVGTGGIALRPTERSHPGMELARESAHGVLFLELNRRGYTWEFVTVDGAVADSGQGRCR